MIHIKDTKKVKLNSTERTAVALGKFDGIHQGHMLLIEQVLKLQRQGYMGVVFTFDMRENHVFDVSNMKTIYTYTYSILFYFLYSILFMFYILNSLRSKCL